MTDHLDKQTQPMDLETKRGRGRPATGQALSNAERQRLYRERQKAQRNEMERELHNAETTLRVDENYTEGVWQELEQARARIVELENQIMKLKGTLKEVDNAAMAQINELRRELADEKVKKLKKAAPQKKRYILQYQVRETGKWVDDPTGDYGSKKRADIACKGMNDMLKEEGYASEWRVRERQWV